MRKPKPSPALVRAFENLFRELVNSVSEAVTHEPRQQQRPKPTRRVIEIDEVLSMVPLSKASVYRMQKAGTFPKSRAIGANRSAWFVDEIESWLEALPHGRRRSRGKSQR